MGRADAKCGRLCLHRRLFSWFFAPLEVIVSLEPHGEDGVLGNFGGTETDEEAGSVTACVEAADTGGFL